MEEEVKEKGRERERVRREGGGGEAIEDNDERSKRMN